MKPYRLVPGLLVLSLLGLATAAAKNDNAAAVPPGLPVSLGDLGAVHRVGAPRLSPDGARIAFAYRDRIHLLRNTGGMPRAVTLAGATAAEPRWSPDGRWLYFVSDRSGSRQLWRLPVHRSGEAEQVTDLPWAVDRPRLSPDGRRLLVVRDDGAEAGGAEERPAPIVIDRLQFKADAGDGYLATPPADHLYSITLESGEVNPLTDGPFSDREPAWGPDGQAVVFVSSRPRHPDIGYANDLWLAAAAHGETSRLRRLTQSERVKSAPAFSPDGAQIAYLSAADDIYGINELRLLPSEGGESRVLTAGLDRTVMDFRFAPDGRSIVFTYANEGARRLARVRLEDGRIEQLIGGRHVVTAMAPGIDGTSGVFRIIGANDAANLYRLHTGGRLEQLTRLNEGFFDARVLGRKESTAYTVADGTRVQAFVTTPPGFDADKRYPAILRIHGGPVNQVTWGYDFTAQYLAARGYVVIEPNPRGSIGRGQAFTRAIEGSWGLTDYPDVMGAVDHLLALGYVDPDRIAVTGYSYGGYMTNVAVTRSDRFMAAAAGAGHSLIIANFGHDIYQKWYRWELGLPTANRDRYDRLSPLLEVEKVTTPTLFLGGRNDWNVPILNSELMYQALRARGIETRLVVYPDTRHGGWRPRFEQDYHRRVVGWFDRFDPATSR